jgi:hypothetical protein
MKEIARIVGVSLSSVSLWVRDIELEGIQRASMRCAALLVVGAKHLPHGPGRVAEMHNRWDGDGPGTAIGFIWPVACCSGPRAREDAIR